MLLAVLQLYPGMYVMLRTMAPALPVITSTLFREQAGKTWSNYLMRLQLQSSYRGRMVQMRLHRWLQERYIDPTQLRPSKRASCCHPTLSSRGVFALCRMRWLNEMLRSPSRTRCHCRTQFQAYPLRLSLTPWRKKAENSRCCCRAGLGVSVTPGNVGQLQQHSPLCRGANSRRKTRKTKEHNSPCKESFKKI